VLKALGRWGGPLLADASDDDAFLGHWLAMPAEVLLGDRLAAGPPLTIELRAEAGQPVTITAVDGQISARVGSADQPDLRISGPHRGIVRLLAGAADPDGAKAAGVSLEGDLGVLARLARPVSPVAAR
jgi:hypothetical protein